jgi:uncharacterized membrane protein HdeD (DUF308 family)
MIPCLLLAGVFVLCTPAMAVEAGTRFYGIAAVGFRTTNRTEKISLRRDASGKPENEDQMFDAFFDCIAYCSIR